MFLAVLAWLLCALPHGARTAGAGPPTVGASIAVHPPKFKFLARFLRSYSLCEPARRALALFVVLSSEEDLAALRARLAEAYPEVSEELWTPVVAPPPEGVSGGQLIAAWKKWYGIAYMMDLGVHGPRYGAMLDAELVMYDEHDCGEGSAWSALLPRLQAMEASKTFPAARIDDSKAYDFGKYQMTGRTYDQALIRENFGWVQRAFDGGCTGERCALVEQQIDLALFSWWTDFPYVNLDVAARLLPRVHPDEHRRQIERFGPVPLLPKGHWRDLMRDITPSRFEIIAYQQWCVLTEGFTFNDVTNITGYAEWGSYNEEPKEKARIAELHPLWISVTVARMAKEGRLPKMSKAKPPLLVFHADHDMSMFDTDRWARYWDGQGPNPADSR